MAGECATLLVMLTRFETDSASKLPRGFTRTRYPLAARVPVNEVIVEVESVANADPALVRFADSPGLEPEKLAEAGLIVRKNDR
jgi:hypothetical protein